MRSLDAELLCLFACVGDVSCKACGLLEDEFMFTASAGGARVLSQSVSGASRSRYQRLFDGDLGSTRCDVDDDEVVSRGALRLFTALYFIL